MTPETSKVVFMWSVKVLFSSMNEADGQGSRLQGLINDQMNGYVCDWLKDTAPFYKAQILVFVFAGSRGPSLFPRSVPAVLPVWRAQPSATLCVCVIMCVSVCVL